MATPEEVAAILERVGASVPASITRGVLKAGLFAEGEVKQRAPVASIETSGYVGGNLRASINTQLVSPTAASVGTNVVYALRQEFGFVGEDALGRVYNQGPNPYFAPAAAAAEPKVVDIITAEIGDGFNAIG